MSRASAGIEEFSPGLAAFLLTDAAREAAATLAGQGLAPGQTLARLVELRRAFSSEQAGALLTLARLRLRAAAKFPHAGQMFFTGPALEQATAWPVALHRAARLHTATRGAGGLLLDLGCGIGGDLLALAQGRPVAAYERDPVRLAFARANADALGLGGRAGLHLDDWGAALVGGRLPPAAAAFADPARRAGTRRLFSLRDVIPPLPALLALRGRFPVTAIKVMPGIADDEIPAGAAVEFVSHDGVAKEAVLWFGLDGMPRRWASVHDGARWHEIGAAGVPAPGGPLEAGCLLYEPDPAVIRAGALAELCAQLDAWLFDPQIAYLAAAGTQPVATPFAAAFRIHEVHRFSLKTLNARLAALEVGQVELKKRGFPVEPEELRPRLRVQPGGRTAVVLFTRRGDERLMLIGERLTQRGGQYGDNGSGNGSDYGSDSEPGLAG